MTIPGMNYTPHVLEKKPGLLHIHRQVRVSSFEGKKYKKINTASILAYKHTKNPPEQLLKMERNDIS